MCIRYLCLSHCAEHFTCSAAFRPHNSAKRKAPFFPSELQLRKLQLREAMNFPMVTQRDSSRTSIQSPACSLSLIVSLPSSVSCTVPEGNSTCNSHSKHPEDPYLTTYFPCLFEAGTTPLTTTFCFTEPHSHPTGCNISLNIVYEVLH